MIGVILRAEQAHALDDAAKWNKVTVPRQGISCDWLLAKDTDILDFDVTNDGTIFSLVCVDNEHFYLFKSVDSGKSWARSSTLPGNLTDLEISESPGSSIYFTDGKDIYKTDRNMLTIEIIDALPAVAGENNGSIKSIDVISSGTGDIILAGIINTGSPVKGGVYILDYTQEDAEWQDTGLTDGVYKVVYSPDFTSDQRIFAVCSDGQNTKLVTKTINEDWNRYYGPAVIEGIVPEAAELAFGSSDSLDIVNRNIYLSIDSVTAQGDVFKIGLAPDSSGVQDMNVGSGLGLSGIDIACLSVGLTEGKEWVYAGLTAGGQVMYTVDDGANWFSSFKQPSGQRITGLAAAPDFTVSKRVFTVTSGHDSAFSCSADGGISYNQVSLIDTDIGEGCITNLTVSPAYEQDSTIFLVTLNSEDMEYSVWRSVNGGNNWERIQCSSVSGIKYVRDFQLSPDFGYSGNTLYIAGRSVSGPIILRSADNGQTTTKYTAPFEIDALCVVSNDTLIAAGYDGNKEMVYRSDNGGQTWSSGAMESEYILNSIRCSPDFTEDGVILAAHTGFVYYSDDSGISFRPLPVDSTGPPFNGKVCVAFDSDFSSSRIVYAASDSPDEGIYRFTIGQDTAWEKIDAGLPVNGSIVDIGVSDTGVLYAVNFDSVDVNRTRGGVERSLNPSFHLLPTFQTIDKGLDDGTHLAKLAIAGDRIWSIDEANDRLLTYHDTMSQPVSLLIPLNNSPGMGTKNIVLDWGTVEGASEYEWQVDYSGYFTTVPYGFEGYTTGSMIRLPELEIDTTYHWRVRVTKPALSDWSETRIFTTTLGESLICPDLLSPGAGAALATREPLFQWSAIAGAEKYELMVSMDSAFSNPVIEKSGNTALPATAWQSDVPLEEGETYYWKVRALGSGSNTDWSAVGAFVTPFEEAGETPVPAVVFTQQGAAPEPLSPAAGCIDVSGRPLFQWEPVPNASCYELIVALDQSFENPVINRAGDYAVPVTAWNSNIDLGVESVYYWKVRAVVGGTYSDWSPVSIFSTGPDIVLLTEDQPEQDTTVLSQPEPVIIQQVPENDDPAFPAWVLYAGLGLLVTMALLQITILMVLIVTRTRRF